MSKSSWKCLMILMLAVSFFAAGAMQVQACSKDTVWSGKEERKVKDFIAAVQEQFNKVVQLEGTSQGGEEIRKLKDMLDSADDFKPEIELARRNNDVEAKRNYQKYARKLNDIKEQVGLDAAIDTSETEAKVDDLEAELDKEFQNLKMKGDPGYDDQQGRLAAIEAKIDALGLSMLGTLSPQMNTPNQTPVEKAYEGLAGRIADMKGRASAMRGH